MITQQEVALFLVIHLDALYSLGSLQQYLYKARDRQPKTCGPDPARQAKSSGPQAAAPLQIVAILWPAMWYCILLSCPPRNILYCIRMRNRTVL